jgi:hypothetical protein
MRGMNKLPVAKRAQILSMLWEGSSMRAITRVTGVSLNTMTKPLIDGGEACAAYHDEHVRDVKASRIQCDEVWAFCYSKQKNVVTAKRKDLAYGDVWTWTALEAISKLHFSYMVDGFDSESTVCVPVRALGASAVLVAAESVAAVRDLSHRGKLAANRCASQDYPDKAAARRPKPQT